MQRPIMVDGLMSELQKVEVWLANTLGVSRDESDNREIPDPFSGGDDLQTLKAAIDRIRPLLWMYLSRQKDAQQLQAMRKQPSSVRTLMDDAMMISDRYVGNND